MKWNEIFQIFELTERLILSDIILLTSHNCGPVQDIFLVMCRLLEWYTSRYTQSGWQYSSSSMLYNKWAADAVILVKMSRLSINLSKRKNSRNYICLMEPLFSLATINHMILKYGVKKCSHEKRYHQVAVYENQFWLTFRFNLDQDTLSQNGSADAASYIG